MEDRQDDTEHRINVDDLGLQGVRDLYMAERARRETIRSQLAVPGSVISFSIFGYIYVARVFDVALLGQPATTAMAVACLLSMAFLLVAVVFLARVELLFLRQGPATTEREHVYTDEHDFFRRALEATREQNDRATLHRSRGFLFMLTALSCFVLGVALLPLHMAEKRAAGRAEPGQSAAVACIPIYERCPIGQT